MRIAPRALQCVVMGFVMLVAMPLAAAQSMLVASGVWCDKPEQVEKLFDLVVREDKSLLEGLVVVNGTVTPPACAVGTLALIPGGIVERLEFDGLTYGVIEVTVLGFERGGLMVWFPAPLRQFGTRPLAEETSA